MHERRNSRISLDSLAFPALSSALSQVCPADDRLCDYGTPSLEVLITGVVARTNVFRYGAGHGYIGWLSTTMLLLKCMSNPRRYKIITKPASQSRPC